MTTFNKMSSNDLVIASSMSKDRLIERLRPLADGKVQNIQHILWNAMGNCVMSKLSPRRSWRRRHRTRREVKTCDRFRVFNRNRSQVFTSKCGPSAMSSSPRSSSPTRYHEVNKKEVSSKSSLVNEKVCSIDA